MAPGLVGPVALLFVLATRANGGDPKEDANMTALLPVDTKGTMVKHRKVLFEYARRVILHGEYLCEDEQADLASQVQELIAMHGERAGYAAVQRSVSRQS